jgi:hypothetical protein
MYSKQNLQRWWKLNFRQLNNVAPGIRGWKKPLVVCVMAGWQIASLSRVAGAALMEEGFNYAAGGSLGINSPWTGTANTSLGIASGSLSVTNLRSIVPGGNNLRISASATASARRNFAATAVTANSVYCSFLVNCAALPTTQQFLTSVLRSGATSASPPDDPLDVYAQPVAGGYTFVMTCVGSDPATANTILAPNTTHLIVIKYQFGTLGLGSLYIDPVPGGTEPVNPDIVTSSDDNIGASNLQVLLFRSTLGQGAWNFDTVRVGTNWSDVTPVGIPLNLTGPQDQAICSGSPALFTVSASGTVPFFYQWRTNGVAVTGATNSSYQLLSPGPNDDSNNYDVVVQDSFSTVTSRVARLSLSTLPAAIKTGPTGPLVTPSSSNAVFTVSAAGDAPLTYQWRTNGVAVAGATNSSFVVTNPASVDPSLQYDVVVSNPCAAVTSSPPVSLVFPSVFYSASDAGPGFFSGENLVLTNVGGLTLQAWSSSSLSVPVPQWNSEGVMQEQPLNDGSGKSFYSINVTPATSPEYYIFGHSRSAPYLAPIPILTITMDPNGFYILADSQMGISPNGSLGTSSVQLSIAPHAGGGLDLTGTGIPGNIYLLQSCTNFQAPLQWLTIGTNVADVNGVIQFSDTNGPTSSRFYRLLGQ